MLIVVSVSCSILVATVERISKLSFNYKICSIALKWLANALAHIFGY